MTPRSGVGKRHVLTKGGSSNAQELANQWRSRSPVARLWESWENPLKPVDPPSILRVVMRMRPRPRWSAEPPVARSQVSVGRSWRIRGHTEEEVQWAANILRPGWRHGVSLLLEAQIRFDEDVSAAGILWRRRDKVVPPLQWTAARTVRNQIDQAFQQDALRGLPKRTVPNAIKRLLSLAFEGKL